MRGWLALAVCVTAAIGVLIYLCVAVAVLHALGASSGAFVTVSICAGFVLALTLVAILEKDRGEYVD